MLVTVAGHIGLVSHHAVRLKLMCRYVSTVLPLNKQAISSQALHPGLRGTLKNLENTNLSL